ncbi:YHS domain-containing protein [Candidatus Woesearchaeota archaeon]|nr:YHS domain-containing protein [Candidatus Woesearchaeota archaeon]
MASDPVCGMEVDESSSDAIIAVVNRKKNYFCSNECRDKFLKNKM